MKKNISFLLSLIFFINFAGAQELFSYTEPASNMAANSLGIRITENFMKEYKANNFNSHLMPELMFGVSKKVMIHGEAFLSIGNSVFKTEGGAIYLKYRFFSKDDIHSHFRMAVFGKYALNNSLMIQPSIDLNGLHSGSEMGLVATQLIHKVALSSTVSWVHAQPFSDGTQFLITDKNESDAINYTFSVGKLMIPKEYVSYNQTNMNLMLETLGQTNLFSGISNLDIAPVLQFIIYSKMRIDLGYRIPVSKQLLRMYDGGGMIRFEYNLFNVVR